GAVVYRISIGKLGEHNLAWCQFIHQLLSNRYKLITNVRSSLMAVNIHITIIELNALHTKRQNLFQELDAVIHLLMEAKHWGLITASSSWKRFCRLSICLWKPSIGD